MAIQSSHQISDIEIVDLGGQFRIKNLKPLYPNRLALAAPPYGTQQIYQTSGPSLPSAEAGLY